MSKPRAYYSEIEPFAADWLRNLIAEGLIVPGDVDERDVKDVTPAELMGYEQCHFFAGIGGWSRALRLAGWPDDRPVWTGSCPCQGFSAAGRGRGFADERHLWPYWFHLIEVCRPPIIFGEQVASKAALEWFDLVSDDLEGTGYAVGPADLCAASIGAPHIRQRLWFVAHARFTGHAPRRAGDFSREGREAANGEKAGVDGGVCELSTDLLGQSAKVGTSGAVRWPGYLRQEHPAPERAGGDAESLADAERIADRCETESANNARQEANRPTDRTCGCGGPSGSVAHPGSGPSPRGPHEPGREAEGGIAPGGIGQDDNPGSVADASECSGFRSESQSIIGEIQTEDARVFTNPYASLYWLPCRDGRWRPTGIVEPSFLGMADGLPDILGFVLPEGEAQAYISPLVKKTFSRVGRLKGYGNAINSYVAAEFIRAFMEIEKESEP